MIYNGSIYPISDADFVITCRFAMASIPITSQELDI